MHVSRLFAALAIALGSVSASISPSPTVPERRAEKIPFNPPENVLDDEWRKRHVTQEEARDMNNAKRMAIGLPPLAPRTFRYRIGGHRKLKHSFTKYFKGKFRGYQYNGGSIGYNQPKPATPSKTPCSKTHGRIKVNGGGRCWGYLSTDLNDFGEYGKFTKDKNAALQVAINKKASSPFSLETINGDFDSFPFLGAVIGYACGSDDLQPGSSNYAYFTPTEETPSLCRPKDGGNAFTTVTGIDQTIESAIWTLNRDNSLTPNWVNTDGSRPTNYIVYTQNAFAITADVNEFKKQFDQADIVTFEFEAK